MNTSFWPNLLTFSRVLIVLPFVILYPDPATRTIWLVGFLILCELTDAFDGMLARRMGAVSDFGKLFDPFSDSVYRLFAFLALLMSGLFPWYALMVLIFRDVAVAYVRVFEATHGTVRAARVSGKIKAIVQGVALIVIAILGAETFGLSAEIVGGLMQLMIWSTIAVTLWSLYDYTQPLWRASEKPKS